MNHGRKIDTVPVLIIFCIFAASVLTVLTLCAGAYQNMTQISGEGDREQTCLSYLWAKVKNADEQGRVSVDSFYGISALCLEEEYDGVAYQTRLYLYDGWICELFSEADIELTPADGTPVMEVGSLSFASQENGLIRVSSEDRYMLIYPRTGTEGLN